MKTKLEDKTYWLARKFFILVSLFIFQYSIVPVSASPIILYQNHHIGISETYVYDEVESSVWLEGGATGGLSRVLSKEKVGSDGEVLGAVASVASGQGGSNVLFWSVVTGSAWDVFNNFGYI